MDQLRLIRIINFFAQIADIYIYDIGIAVMIHVPYIRLYLLPADYDILIADQI